MKKIFILFFILSIWLPANATNKDSTLLFALPDTVKAISFMAEIKVQATQTKKESFAGIKTDMVSLFLESEKKEKEIVFAFPSNARVMATGLDVEKEDGELEWEYNWSLNESYKLLIAVATDSADNFSLYSGYIFLPRENKWKLIGTCKITGRWNTIQQPAFVYSTGKKSTMQAVVNEVWCQRNTGSWKNMTASDIKFSPINLLSHTDSLLQLQKEKEEITKAMSSGYTDVTDSAQGLFYKMMKVGTGASVNINDTVVIHYKGYLFNDNTVFDQTKEKPATFPLKRLITGWQIGVPLCKAGGKIKLVIPSSMAYSIRTRAAKIPPNSILVFEIEVVDIKSPK